MNVAVGDRVEVRFLYETSKFNFQRGCIEEFYDGYMVGVRLDDASLPVRTPPLGVFSLHELRKLSVLELLAEVAQ